MMSKSNAGYTIAGFTMFYPWTGDSKLQSVLPDIKPINIGHLPVMNADTEY